MNLIEVQVGSLFGSQLQYRIPLFQRHYVWDKEDQWQPLWEDIEQRANRRLVQPQASGFSHFTGAVVLQQERTNIGEVPKYKIIDGQQRLTTFQIVLCALRDICKEHNHNEVADHVNLYILNQGMLLHDDECYKLIPTEFDREAFQSLTDGFSHLRDNRIHSAYRYFKGEIARYVNGNKGKILVLFHSIQHDFGLVQILLGEDDEPEKIFESLNARGKDLLQFDLLRNNLFLRAGEDDDSYYRKYWKHFETPYWDPEEEKSGASSEIFLQHFLMAKLGTESVKPEFKVYQRQYCPGLELGIESEFSELKRYSDIYQEMTDCMDNSEIGRRMKFYQIFGITTLHPFTLFGTCEIRLSGKELQNVFDILESYTIRRMLCRYGRRALANYNIFFSELISEFQNNFSVGNLITRLAQETSNTRRYPADDEVDPALHPHYYEYPALLPEIEDSALVFPDNRAVKAALHGLWVETAGAIRKRLIRYILYRIELKKREETRYSEPGELTFDQLTLEHVMPIEWKKEWRLPVTEDAVIYEKPGSGSNYNVSVNQEIEGTKLLYAELFSDSYKTKNPDWKKQPSRDGLVDATYADAFNLALARDYLLQSIGNLTLVTGSLNSHMSNDPFAAKKGALSEHSGMTLNKQICRKNGWDVNEIRTRAEELIQYFCKVWPSLDWFQENVS